MNLWHKRFHKGNITADKEESSQDKDEMPQNALNAKERNNISISRDHCTILS